MGKVSYQVVVLEVQTHTREVDERLDTSLSELLRVSDTRALENERRTEGASGNNDLLPSPEGAAVVLGGRERLGRNGLDSDCAATLHDDLVDLGVDGEVQILVNRTRAVDVSVG